MQMDFDEDLMLGAEASVRFAFDEDAGEALEQRLATLLDADGEALEQWTADGSDGDEDGLLALAESIRRSLDLPLDE